MNYKSEKTKCKIVNHYIKCYPEMTEYLYISNVAKVAIFDIIIKYITNPSYENLCHYTYSGIISVADPVEKNKVVKCIVDLIELNLL